MGRKRLAAEPGRIRYGILTVLAEFYETGQRHPRLFCVCDCGVVKDLDRHHVLTGHSGSCGCQIPRRVHGHCYRGQVDPVHFIWRMMKQRCMNPRNPGWKNYGGRGIKVCERWKDFRNFLQDMGPRPLGRNGQVAAYSLERINNDGNYEPGNCKWATVKEQRANQRYLGRKRSRRIVHSFGSTPPENR